MDHLKSEHDWLKVAQDFDEHWSFTNALGGLGHAIENKHLKLAGEKKLRNSQRILLYVIIGDNMCLGSNLI